MPAAALSALITCAHLVVTRKRCSVSGLAQSEEKREHRRKKKKKKRKASRSDTTVGDSAAQEEEDNDDEEVSTWKGELR